MKVLRYTIKTVIEVAANEPGWFSEVESVLDKGRELGTSEIEDVEMVEREKSPTD